MCWEGLYGVLMCVCVCEREVTRGGHGSGQHQLSECEVQPQAKASFACGDKPDPPHLLIPSHTHTHKHTTRSSPSSLFTFPLQRVCTETAHSANSAGTFPCCRLGLCTTATARTHQKTPHSTAGSLSSSAARTESNRVTRTFHMYVCMYVCKKKWSVSPLVWGEGHHPKRSWSAWGRRAGTGTDLVCVVAPTPGQKVLAKHQTAPPPAWHGAAASGLNTRLSVLCFWPGSAQLS